MIEKTENTCLGYQKEAFNGYLYQNCQQIKFIFSILSYLACFMFLVGILGLLLLLWRTDKISDKYAKTPRTQK